MARDPDLVIQAMESFHDRSQLLRQIAGVHDAGVAASSLRTQIKRPSMWVVLRRGMEANAVAIVEYAMSRSSTPRS